LAKNYAIIVLYEIAFAFGSCEKPFSLYTVVPRQLIPHDSTFTGDDLLAVIVEASEDAPDPCDYLDAPTVYSMFMT
jgi:hypothetical protein